LTEKVRRRPYSVVLFDEIEKAHADIFNVMLQIMEEGQVTDSYGRKVDFRNAILIITSNVGADLIKRQGNLGFGKHDGASNYERLKKSTTAEVENNFRPEFLNRLDAQVVFRYLEREDLRAIIDIELVGVKKRLHDLHLDIELTAPAGEFLMDKGYNQDFGARPLRRAIEHYIEDPMAESILRNEFHDGEKIIVEVGVAPLGEAAPDSDGGEVLVFHAEAPAAPLDFTPDKLFPPAAATPTETALISTDEAAPPKKSRRPSKKNDEEDKA
jgi:ATP-dependent Clp protease ATP-binding subunit ClpC